MGLFTFPDERTNERSLCACVVPAASTGICFIDLYFSAGVPQASSSCLADISGVAGRTQLDTCPCQCVCKPAVQLLHHSCPSPSRVPSLSSFLLVTGVWQRMRVVGVRGRESRMSCRGEWEMLHLGGPAVLFLFHAQAVLCCGRVQCGAGSLLNGCLLVPCPARAPWASAGCHPTAQTVGLTP